MTIYRNSIKHCINLIGHQHDVGPKPHMCVCIYRIPHIHLPYAVRFSSISHLLHFISYIHNTKFCKTKMKPSLMFNLLLVLSIFLYEAQGMFNSNTNMYSIMCIFMFLNVEWFLKCLFGMLLITLI